MALSLPGTPLSLSSQTANDLGGAASDLFSAFAAPQSAALQAQGDTVEATNYTSAAALALQNEQYTAVSTAAQQSQEQLELEQSIGSTQADVAGAGFSDSGSALYVLRQSMQQGALIQGLTGEQGAINEAGYAEQAQADKNLAAYAQEAASSATQSGIMGEIGGIVGSVLKIGAAAISL